MKAKFWLSASIAALMSTAAHAQSAPATTDPTAAAQADNATSTDVVVTAERRSTGLQRTAVAATVLTGEDLTRKSILSVEQLQFATPSLTVNTSGQANSFNIRGIGKTEITSSIGVGVVTYRDGVATFPGYFQTEPYYDIASVEVLRGPQGTFAGGNATGGAVFITETNPTTDKVKGYALAQYGNYNDVKLQGAVNLPLGDTLAIRIAGNYEGRDTFFKVSGPWTGNPGNLNAINGRISLLWQPDSHLRVLIKGDYNKVNYGGFPATPAYSVVGGAYVANSSDPFVVTSNAPMYGQDEFGRISANISYRFDSGLTIRSISGYQRGTTQELLDTDGTATGNPGVSVGNDTFQDFAHEYIWSQEVNVVSPDSGPFTWLIGGYVQRDSYTFPEGNGYVALTPNSLLTSLRIVGTNPHTATALFGQVGYKLTDALQITVGGRWSRTTSRNDALYPVTLPALGINTTLTQHDFAANKKVDGKVALNWTIDSHNFVYAFVATGSKAGGLNGTNLFGITPRAFAPEQVTDYELGWKGTLMNGHLRTQVGAYYNRYKNFQVSIVDPTTPNFNSIFNVPDATRLYGVEASAQGSFGDFQFDASLSLSHSEVGNFYAFDPRLAHSGACDAAIGPATSSCIALGGRRQTYSPQFTLSGGLQYAIRLGDRMTLTPRVDYAHISAVWGTLFENPALGDYLGERNIINAQLTLARGDWAIGGYATNLTNQHYIGSLNGNRRLPGLPRQYGVRVSTKF
jgi:iron complex outermembrane receptor protein